ncbi:MAG: outer membrane beta-barrel protein [Bryobacteraceae bacterium]
MHTLRVFTLLTLAAGIWAPAATAQRWEFGAGGGGSFYTSKTASSAAGSADATFRPAAAITGYLGQNLYNYVSGEIRYTLGLNEMQLKSGGATGASFAGRTQAVHYDFLIHTAPRRAKTRPFFAVGGGYKRFEGTGTEAAFQPLQNFALLTRTAEWTPVLSVGAGVKFQVGENVNLRVEFRDYISRFPREVIAPAPGATIGGGWIHNFVPMVGLSYLF